MIKKSTKITLLLLYANQETPTYYSLDRVNAVLTALGITSQRSLWHLLEKNNYVVQDAFSQEKSVAITATGLEQLKQAFPILSEQLTNWDKEWYAAVFLTAPASDANFRYLRTYLLAQYAASLSRGVYIFPSSMKQTIEFEIERSYHRSVTLTSFKPTDAALFEQQILALYSIKDIFYQYSGVSKSVGELLAKSGGKKVAINRQKKLVSSIVESLCSVGERDIGLVPDYFPQVPEYKQLLHSLQTALFSSDE